jgi:hypothetical protein
MMSHRGVSRPMRAGGLLLLGIAAVAAIIGITTAVTGNGEPQAVRPPDEPSTSASTAPGTGDGTTTTAPEATTTTADSVRPPTPGSESSEPSPKPSGSAGPGGPGAGDGDGKGDAVKSVSVRVYNNSNVQGLANRAAEDLRAHGWNVVATGNYSEGTIYTTTAYYRPGTSEKAAAEAIGAEFGMRVEPRFQGIADSSPGVIVIVTRDYSSGKS